MLPQNSLSVLVPILLLGWPLNFGCVVACLLLESTRTMWCNFSNWRAGWHHSLNQGECRCPVAQKFPPLASGDTSKDVHSGIIIVPNWKPTNVQSRMDHYDLFLEYYKIPKWSGPSHQQFTRAPADPNLCQCLSTCKWQFPPSRMSYTSRASLSYPCTFLLPWASFYPQTDFPREEAVGSPHFTDKQTEVHPHHTDRNRQIQISSAPCTQFQSLPARIPVPLSVGVSPVSPRVYSTVASSPGRSNFSCGYLTAF